MKNEVNLLPGVCGFFWSMACDLVDEVDSVRSGGGREPGFKAMFVSSTVDSCKTPLDSAARAPAMEGGSGKSSVDTRGKVPLDEDFAKLSGCDSARVRTADWEAAAMGVLSFDSCKGVL